MREVAQRERVGLDRPARASALGDVQPVRRVVVLDHVAAVGDRAALPVDRDATPVRQDRLQPGDGPRVAFDDGLEVVHLHADVHHGARSGGDDARHGLRDDPVRRRRRDRDDHAQPPAAAEHDHPAAARRGRGTRSRVATRDPEVKVIILRGAGRAFCAGYDFGGGFQHWGDAMMTDGRWDPGKDFAMATAPQLAPTQKLLSIWRTPKPVIAQVHGWCVGGGSDFALVRRPRDRLRGRGHRHALQPHVGRVPVGHVDPAPRPGARQVPRVDRAAAERPAGRRHPADQRGGPVRAARGPRARAGAGALRDPVLPAGGDEAVRQPRTTRTTACTRRRRSGRSSTG